MNLELWLIRGLIFTITRYYKYVHSYHIESIFIPNPLTWKSTQLPNLCTLTSWGLRARHHCLGDLGAGRSPVSMKGILPKTDSSPLKMDVPPGK